MLPKKKTRNKKTLAKIKWITVPQGDFSYWFSQWLLPTMVMTALNETGTIPKKIGLEDTCVFDNTDGSADIRFHVK